MMRRFLKTIKSVLDRICSNCEMLIDTDEVVCPHCGEPVNLHKNI